MPKRLRIRKDRAALLAGVWQVARTRRVPALPSPSPGPSEPPTPKGAAAAAGTPIELVLLDIGLPDASGIDVAPALGGVRPAPDIIAISSERDLSVVRSAVAHGIAMYLLKPFTFAAFRDKLERYRQYREALGSGHSAAGQHEIDRAMNALRSADQRLTAPKGVSPDTLDLVVSALRGAPDGLNASEAAARLGISRVTAWRYLERLAEDGAVGRNTEYGRAGRPQVRYVLSR